MKLWIRVVRVDRPLDEPTGCWACAALLDPMAGQFVGAVCDDPKSVDRSHLVGLMCPTCAASGPDHIYAVRDARGMWWRPVIVGLSPEHARTVASRSRQTRSELEAVRRIVGGTQP